MLDRNSHRDRVTTLILDIKETVLITIFEKESQRKWEQERYFLPSLSVYISDTKENHRFPGVVIMVMMVYSVSLPE